MIKWHRALRKLIRSMWNANPTWGKRRIQAELAKLGIGVSDSTVARYKPTRRRPPSHSWRTFLDNHAEDIVAYVEALGIEQVTTTPHSPWQNA